MSDASPATPAASPTPAHATPPSQLITAWCDRHRHWLFLALALLYLLAFNGQWRPTPDSAIHLAIAENIVAGEGFVHPTRDEVRVNPGLSYLLAGVMRVFGTEAMWAANLLMLVIAFGAIGVAYRLFQLDAGRPAAVLLAMLLGSSMLVFEHSHRLLTDIPFLLGGLLFLLGWQMWTRPGGNEETPRPQGWRGREVAAAVGLMLVGAAVMVVFRTVAITFLGAVGIALLVHLWHHRDRPGLVKRAMLVLGITAVAVTGAVVTSAGLSTGDPVGPDGPRDDLALIQSRLAELHVRLVDTAPGNMGEMLTQNLPVAAFSVDFSPFVNLPLALVLLAGGAALWRRQPLWALLILAFLLQFALFVTNQRYFLVLMPVLVLGWWHAALWLERRLSVPLGHYLLIFMLVLWAGPNLVRSANVTIEQRATPYLLNLSDGKYHDLHRLGEAIGEHVEHDALVLTDSGHQKILTYWSRRTVLASERLNEFASQQGPFYVIEPGGQRLEELLDAGWRAADEPVVELDAALDGLPDWSLRRVIER